MIFCSILAGGIGGRMGSEIPKQYIEIVNKPIIIHTIEHFISISEIDLIMVLCPVDWIDYTKELVEKYVGSNNRVEVIEGGETRSDTLMKSIEYIERTHELEDDIIITHDAARPFVTEKIIRENIAAAKEYGACSTYIRAIDTIAISSDGQEIMSIPDRSQMYQTQTPQTFVARELRELYEKLTNDEKDKLTDAVGIYIANNKKVHIVEGEQSNIKITYPYDLTLAEAIMDLYK